MNISIITLFPAVVAPYLNTSILSRAQKKGKVKFNIINLRDFGEGKHQVVDSRIHGGGAGMILRADILSKAIKSVPASHVILTSASGKLFNQQKAKELSKLDNLTIICGHYEGVDQRLIDNLVSEEISIGDFVLTGGELPALMIIDSITRLIPGVLDKAEATIDESFENNLLEYPHYGKPTSFEGKKVPSVLLSGHHQKIQSWRKKQAIKKTRGNRPDLLKRVTLTSGDD